MIRLSSAMAKHWSERLVTDGATSPEQANSADAGRPRWLDPPGPEEVASLLQLTRRSAELARAHSGELLQCQVAWQDAAHVIFNMKEFLYVR